MFSHAGRVRQCFFVDRRADRVPLAGRLDRYPGPGWPRTGLRSLNAAPAIGQVDPGQLRLAAERVIGDSDQRSIAGATGRVILATVTCWCWRRG